MGELYISATWITANGSDILGFSKSAQIIFRSEHPHCADTTQHPEEDKRSIRQHMYPSQRATIDRNKILHSPAIRDERQKSHLMGRPIFSVGQLFILPVVAVLIKAQSGSQRHSDTC